MGEMYLVTGGSGFIGSHIVRGLLERGDRVRVLDNFSTGRRENLDGFWGDIDLVEGDLRSYERVHTAVTGCGIVLHLGALPSVPRSVQDPLTSHAVNTTGTLNIILASRDAGAGRIVFASSSSVYGETPGLPKTEAMRQSPMSPYGVSKLAAEQYCIASGGVYDVGCVALRLFNVFGPRQDPMSQYSAVVPRFVDAALNGEQPVIYGDGSTSRDFTFVENVVDAFLLASAAKDAEGRVVNVACGEQHTLNELVKEISLCVGVDLRASYEPDRVGDIPHSFASIDVARDVLGFSPGVGFAEGIRRTVEWMQAHSRSSGTDGPAFQQRTP